MRILFVLEYYHPHIGGLETLFKNLTEKIVADDHQVTVITNRYKRSLPRQEKHGNLKILRYSFVNRYLFTLFAFLPTFFYSFKHDLIHTTSYNAGLPAFFAGLLSRTPVIITFHEVWGDLWTKLPYFPRWKSILHRWFESFLLSLPFRQFVGVSQTTSKQLEAAGVPKTRITTIYNGLDYDDFEGLDEVPGRAENDIFRFLYFGRLGISKGLDVLVPAFAELIEMQSHAELTLVIPKNPSHLYLTVLADLHRMDLMKKVKILHDLSRDQLLQEIHRSDCVVIPSYSEGFCFVAVESMALQVPIISSHQGALAEVVAGKYLAYGQQSSTRLSEAMHKAIEGKWNFKPPRKYFLSDTIRQYLELYQEIHQSR